MQTYYAKPPYMLSANTAWLDPEHDEGAAQRRRLPAGARHVDQRRPDRQGRLREHRREGEPDRPAADLEQVDRPGAGREARVQVQHRGGEGAARGERLQGHERRRLRREQERPADQPPADRAERLVRLDDGDPDHRGVARRTPGSRSRRPIPTSTASSTSATRASSTSSSTTTSSSARRRITYYDYLFHLPVADTQTFANYSRFTASGPKPWALTLALNKVKPANVAKQKQIQSQIQKYILEELPAIPLWYNGMWSQYNTTYWTNFPKSAGPGLQTTPSVWNGYLNMTGIDALARLKPESRARARARHGLNRPGRVVRRGGAPPSRHGCRARPLDRRSWRRRDPLPRPQEPPLPPDLLRRGHDRLGDPSAHARRPDRRA